MSAIVKRRRCALDDLPSVDLWKMIRLCTGEGAVLLRQGGEMLAERTVLSEADAGREAAQRLYSEGLKAQIEDPLTAEFARAAVAEFSRLQREHTPGIYLEALEAAEAGAEDLNIDEYHGVIEVVQNADDAAGRELRIAVRSRAGGRDLLFVHDGEAVRLPDLIAMALAFLSTKREDPYSKGRFGIGLKTLKRLGDTLTVHCGPYHAAIASSAVSPAPEAGAIPTFYRPDRGETMLELRLRPGFSSSDFKGWLSQTDVSSMLFLESLRSITLVTLRTRKPSVSLRLEEERLPERMLTVGRHSLLCSEMILRDRRTDRVWHRYTVDRPVPPSAPKRRKAYMAAIKPLRYALVYPMLLRSIARQWQAPEQVRRVRVTDPIAAARPHDYADAFELRLEEPDGLSPEEWVRAGVDATPAWIKRVAGHADGLGSARIVESSAEVVVLEDSDPLMDTVMIGRNLEPQRRVLTTVLHYRRPVPARAVWALVGVLHRRTAKRLVAGGRRQGPGATSRAEGVRHAWRSARARRQGHA
jgi:hypothetical protein